MAAARREAQFAKPRRPPAWTALAALVIALSSAHRGPASAQSPPAATAPGPWGRPFARPPEATACATDADCVNADVDHEDPNRGCCPMCNGHEALNRAWAARRPRCNPRYGSCAISCMSSTAAGARVVCATGRCALDYPVASNQCRSDFDCAVLPRLAPTFGPDGCRLICGEYISVDRFQAGAVLELYRNRSAAGTCRADCAEPIPDPRCVERQCGIVDPVVLHIANVRGRAPTIAGPIASLDVQRVVAEGVRALESCTGRPRRLIPRNDIELRLEFTIDASGHTTVGDLGWLAERYPDLGACVRRVVSTWSFVAPAGGHRARVSYPLLYDIAGP